MIKTRINNEYKDIVKIFGGGTLQKEIIKVWSREAQEYVYESSVEYTGTLPITINANGDVLLDYRIYGTSGGVGEPTENLIDASKPDVQQRVELEPNTDYCLCKYTGQGQGGSPSCYVYDKNDNRLFGDYINVWVSYSFKNPSNGAYAIILFNSHAEGKVSFTKGRATNNNTLYPTDYIPYGYKLPMTVQSANLFDRTGEISPYYINRAGEITQIASGQWFVSDFAPVQPNTTYTFTYNSTAGSDGYHAFYNDNKEPISTVHMRTFTFTTPNDAKYMRFTYRGDSFDIMLNLGSTALPYVPYSRADTPVYIGDTPLEEDEYVDFEEQKVYKRTENLFNGRGENNYGYYDNANGRFIDDENYKHWKFSVEEGDVIRWTKTGAGWGCYWSKGVYRGRLWGTNNPFTVPAEVDEITNNFDSSVWDSAMVTKNQPLPADYVPYLQPTDPPVSFPDIPSIKGETVIDYDGDPKPSQMYVKYRR